MWERIRKAWAELQYIQAFLFRYTDDPGEPMAIDRGPLGPIRPRILPQPDPAPIEPQTFEDLEREADEQLRHCGAPVKRDVSGKLSPGAIVRITPECILFVGRTYAYTAWKRTIGGKLHVRWQRGWPLEPSAHMHSIFDKLEAEAAESGRGSE